MEFDLHAAVRDITDRIAIRELAARYNRAADDGDHAAWVGAYTDDGVFDVGGHQISGAEALMSYIITAPYGTVHITLDPIIEIDGDIATHTCTFIIGRRTADNQINALLATGRYNDTLRRTPAGWRFTSRQFNSDLAFDKLAEKFAAEA
jgi:ketosteroid isomerase-like protein